MAGITRLMLPCVYPIRVIQMNDVAAQILSALRAAGSGGLLIDELADRLGIDSKTVATTIEQLTSEGLVMQKQELKNDRPLIRAQLGGSSEPSGLSDLNGCPCFHCLKINRCGLRQPDSPATCRALEEWMNLG